MAWGLWAVAWGPWAVACNPVALMLYGHGMGLWATAWGYRLRHGPMGYGLQHAPGNTPFAAADKHCIYKKYTSL